MRHPQLTAYSLMTQICVNRGESVKVVCCSYNNYVNASNVCSVKINILHVLYACDLVFCFLCRIQTIFVPDQYRLYFLCDVEQEPTCELSVFFGLNEQN